MTFPTLEATSTPISAGATTSPTVNIPAGVSSGFLLLGFYYGQYDAITTPSWPAGWTEIHASSPTSAMLVSIAYRVADGTEGSTISLTTGNREYSSVCESYSGHDSSTNAPAIATATSSFGNQNPPNLTPGGGALDYKWIVTAGRDNSTTAIAPPTNYTETAETNGSGAPSLAIANRDLNASSENPGTWTNTGSGTWLAATIAIFPGTEGTGGGGTAVPVFYHHLQQQGIA